MIKLNTILNILLIGLVLFYLGRYFYLQPKFINGEGVPNFEAELLNGESMSLSELKGKYVLVDFWGSWCGPCRVENPKLVELYNIYGQADFTKIDGFEIVSVGIEKRADRWKKAIQQDGLYWKYHVLDQSESLKFFNSPIASEFGITQVPTKYLLNEKGVIINVDPSVEEVAKLLEAQL